MRYWFQSYRLGFVSQPSLQTTVYLLRRIHVKLSGLMQLASESNDLRPKVDILVI